MDMYIDVHNSACIYMLVKNVAVKKNGRRRGYMEEGYITCADFYKQGKSH